MTMLLIIHFAVTWALVGLIWTIQRLVRTNSSMSPRQVNQFCRLDSESTGYLEHAMEKMGFSGRAHDRILKAAKFSNENSSCS